MFHKECSQRKIKIDASKNANCPDENVIFKMSTTIYTTATAAGL
jgi:hypothetical protein